MGREGGKRRDAGSSGGPRTRLDLEGVEGFWGCGVRGAEQGRGKRRVAGGTGPGAVGCAGDEGARQGRSGASEGPQAGRWLPRADNGRGAEGRDPGPGAGRAGEGHAGDAGRRGEDAWTRAPRAAVSPGPARRRLGPGTPLRFSFRGARCRRAPRFPREMAAPARLAWGSPGFPLCAGNKNNKERGNQSKVVATQVKAAPGASRGADRVWGAAGGDRPSLPGLSARSRGAP